MKKLIYYLFLLTGFGLNSEDSFAQSGKVDRAPVPNHPMSLKVSGHTMQTSSTTPGNSIQALWDIRFNYDVEASSGLLSSAGICFVDKKFIISKWNGADTVTIFDSVGNFIQTKKINNVGGIRAMAYDGTFIYAGNNTTAIQVINPTTLVRTRQFTVPASVGAVRWITYNPAGNNGLGSFYVGNFSTAIFEINKPTGTTATVLGNIPAAVHGLTGIYGMAYEPNGANSKFWAFVQDDPVTGAASQSIIAQLSSTGVQTGVFRNSQVDANAPAGIAGGIFIGQVPGYTTPTLMVALQGEVVLGYDFTPLAFDAAVDSFNISNRMVAWPKELSFAPNFGGRVRSVGVQTMSNVSANVRISNIGNGSVIENLPVSAFNLAAGGIKRFISPAIDPATYTVGNYRADAYSLYTGDQNPGNDTLTALFAITDSTMAKDYAYISKPLAGQVGIGAASDQDKAMGVIYNAPTATYVTSVSYFLTAPAVGQPSSASLFSISGGTISTTPLATTGIYTATTQDNQNGKLVTLAFPQPVFMPAGDFVVGVNELGDSTLRIGFTGQIYTPNTFFVKWLANAGGTWSELGTFGSNFQKAVSIYPNFGLGFQQAADIPMTISDTALCAGQTFDVPFAPTGTTYLTGNEFKLEISNAAGDFGSPTTIGMLSGTTSGTISATLPAGLVAGSGYKLRITATKPLRAGDVQSAPKVKALPVSYGSIAGINSICPNDSNKIFSVNPQVGVSQYIWTVPADASIQSNPDSNAIIVRFGATGGPITVAGINSCGTGPITTKNVGLTIVQPATATIFTPSSTVCLGAQVSFLSTATNQGTSPTYQWLKNGQPIVDANSTSLTTNLLVDGDIISLQVTSSIFCGAPNIAISNGVTITVTQPQTPTAAITSNATGNSACAGTDITFTGDVTSGGGTSPLFQWFKNATLIPGATQIALTINTLADGDTVKLRYKVTGSCLTANEIFSNKVKSTILPAAPVTYTVGGNTLTAVATAAISYAWYLNGTVIPGATTAEYTITESGQYCVEVSYDNGCKSKSPCTQQTVVGVDELLATGVWSIFPNPAGEELFINRNNLPINEFKIYNSLGQLLQSTSLEGSASGSISLKNMPSGVYRIVGKSTNGQSVQKTFVKK